MRTPNLIDVPQDRPTRKQMITRLKIEHMIQTQDAGRGWEPKENRWIGCHMPSAYQCPYVPPGCDLFTATAKACRILEDTGLLVEGPTEWEVILKVCANLEIYF